MFHAILLRLSEGEHRFATVVHPKPCLICKDLGTLYLHLRFFYQKRDYAAMPSDVK